jgi:hypothetical protein
MSSNLIDYSHNGASCPLITDSESKALGLIICVSGSGNALSGIGGGTYICGGGATL